MPQNHIRFIVYNIISAGGNNLNLVLRAMNHMHIDLGFLLETKLPHDKYTKQCEGYTVHSTLAEGYHQGGLAIFYHNTEQWTVEGIKAFGPNVLRCSLVSGNRRWTCIGIYIPPSDIIGETLNWLEQATEDGTDPVILFGDLNCNLDFPQGGRGHDISSAMSLMNLSDVAKHFPHPRGRWTWSQWRQGRYIRSTTDYILAERPLEFRRWAIKIPRYNSDHRAIVAELTVCSRREHRRYSQQREYPISFSHPLRRIDQMFEDLCKFCEPPEPHDHRDNSWISQEAWALIDKRASMVRKHRFNHHVEDDEPVAKRTRSQDVDSFRNRHHLMGSCAEHCVRRLCNLSKRI